MHISAVPNWIPNAAGVVVILLAFWRGGAEERAVAVAVLLAIANNFADFLAWTKGAPTDAFALVVCLACVLRGRRYWTIWAAASVLLSLITDLLNVVPGLTLWAYLSAQRVWYAVLLTSLLFGVLTHRAGSARPGAAQASPHHQPSRRPRSGGAQTEGPP